MNSVSTFKIVSIPLLILGFAGAPDLRPALDARSVLDSRLVSDPRPVSGSVLPEGRARGAGLNGPEGPKGSEGAVVGFGETDVSGRGGRAESFLLISDIHLGIDKTASYDKDPNDTNKELWDFTRKKINEVLSGEGSLGKTKWRKPSFILFLGDMPLHRSDAANARKNDSIVLHDLREIAEKAHCPLLYVPGNNDSGKGDYFPLDQNMFEMDAAYKDVWPMVGVDATKTGPDDPRVIRGMGGAGVDCYSAFPLGTGPGKGLRVVGINSVVYTPAYYARVPHDKVQAIADAELDCLQEQLKQADSLGQKVVIAMHVPPGFDGFKRSDLWDTNLKYHNGNKTMLNEFLDLFSQYQQVIVGMVASHTHMDGLRKLSDTGQPYTGLMLSAPGIDPGHGNNPAFKLVTYARKSFQWEDAVTFYEPFYPTKTVQDWGDHAYSLREQLSCQASRPLRQCVGSMSDSSLAKALLPIYRAEAPTSSKDAGEIHVSLVVKPD